MNKLAKVLNWVFIIAVIVALVYIRIDYQNKLDAQVTDTEQALQGVQGQMVENKEQIARMINGVNEKMDKLIEDFGQVSKLPPLK
jgi:hypothetical protein